MMGNNKTLRKENIKMEEWIIAASNSDEYAPTLIKCSGTKDEVKKFLYKLVKEKKDMEEAFDMGDIEEYRQGSELYAYLDFSNYHISYLATKLSSIENIKLREN